MKSYLTDRQIGRLLRLVRADAKLRGYGGKWTEDNSPRWPVALAELRTIAQKLHSMRAENDWKSAEEPIFQRLEKEN